MSRSKVTVTGIKELEANLKKLGTSLNKEMKPTLEAAAQPIIEDAKRNAPVGDTHNLKDGIDRYRTKVSKNGVTVDVGPSSKAWYAIWVEYGHNIVKFGKILGNVQPRPFLRPAYDTKKHQAQQVIRDKLAEVLRRVGR